MVAGSLLARGLAVDVLVEAGAAREAEAVVIVRVLAACFAELAIRNGRVLLEQVGVAGGARLSVVGTLRGLARADGRVRAQRAEGAVLARALLKFAGALRARLGTLASSIATA